jgi:hypothetical protein
MEINKQFDFLKLVISVRGGDCGYSSPAQKPS